MCCMQGGWMDVDGWMTGWQDVVDVGIMMALGLGLVLGVIIAVVALCTVCCVHYWSVRVHSV